MTALACTVCRRDDLPPHELHIRSVLFEQVAWCGPCWGLRAAVEACFVPVQRRASQRAERMSA